MTPNQVSATLAPLAEVTSTPAPESAEAELMDGTDRDARERAYDSLVQRTGALSARTMQSIPFLERSTVAEHALAKRTAELTSQHVELGPVVSELRHAQTQLLHSQKLEALGSMAAGIAHEINTPAQFASDNSSFLRKAYGKLLYALRAYEALVEDLEQGPPTSARLARERQLMERIKLQFLIEEIPHALDGVQEGLSRIGSFVRAVKEFSHPSNDLPALVNLHEIIENAITVSRNEWKYVAELTTDFALELPPVPCLREELGQVLVNLIINAAQAIQSNLDLGNVSRGLIRVVTRAGNGCAEVRVSDNGCGIPEAIKHRVFEPFFTTKPVGTGTGQGLAIAYAVVVEKHHGKILFDSLEGRGTTFILHLPLAEPDSAPTTWRTRDVP